MKSALRPSPRNCCCGGCLIALLILAVLTAMVFIPPPPPPTITPQQKAQSEEHVREVKNEIATIKKKAQEKTEYPFTLKMTEQDINTFLQMDPQAQDILNRGKLQGAFVRIQDGKVLGSASRYVHGVLMNGTMTVIPELNSDKMLIYRVESLDVGRLALPSSMVQSVTQDLIHSVASKMFDTSFKMEAVSVEGDAIVVKGNTK
jgi:uncharacterized protein YpmS